MQVVEEFETQAPKESACTDEREEGTGDEDGVMRPGEIPEKVFNLDFEICFHEHKSTKTFHFFFTILGTVYKYTKLTIYHIIVMLTGLPIALIWGLVNGCTVYIMVWLYQPLLRVVVLCVYACSPIFTAPMQAGCTPIIDVLARVFRQIRVKTNSGGEGTKKHIHIV